MMLYNIIDYKYKCNHIIWVHFGFTSIQVYSQGSNTEHSNTESIRKPNVLKVRLRMAQPVNRTFYHSKTEHSKWPL